MLNNAAIRQMCVDHRLAGAYRTVLNVRLPGKKKHTARLRVIERRADCGNVVAESIVDRPPWVLSEITQVQAQSPANNQRQPDAINALACTALVPIRDPRPLTGLVNNVSSTRVHQSCACSLVG